MPQRIRDAFPNVDELTEWYLLETIYCLQHYANMNEDDSFQVVVSSSVIRDILGDDPRMLHRDTGFYWAMSIVHGFDTPWWQDAKLVEQEREYIQQRHHPPIK